MRTEYQVDVVLRKLGIEARLRNRRLWAHCPRAGDKRFHETADKDPSWFAWSNLMPEKAGLNWCFSCKWGGSITDLVTYSLGLKDDFSSTAYEKARAWLDGNVVDAHPVTSVSLRVSPVYAPRFRLPPEVIVEDVDAWPSSVRSYLVDDRHIPEWQARRWRIGYAVDGRLSGRVVLITRDEDGVPVNYHARSIGSGKRYLMPASSESPDLRILFGEEHWRPDGRLLVLTEGGFNAFAIERVLVDFWTKPIDEEFSVCAISGSHVHPEVVARISRFHTVLVATDNDVAGRHARQKLTAALARHVNLQHAEFPAGEDADSLPPKHLRRIIGRALMARASKAC